MRWIVIPNICLCHQIGYCRIGSLFVSKRRCKMQIFVILQPLSNHLQPDRFYWYMSFAAYPGRRAWIEESAVSIAAEIVDILPGAPIRQILPCISLDGVVVEFAAHIIFPG